MVEWCLEHLAPRAELWEDPRCPWYYYEDLREDFEGQLDRLAAYCGLGDRDRILQQARIPSASTHPERQKEVQKSGGGRAHAWLETVDPKVIAATQEVLDVFGIAFYRAGEAMPLKPVPA